MKTVSTLRFNRAIAGVLAAASITIAAWSASSLVNRVSAEPAGRLAVGQSAPEFTLTNVATGDPISLNSLRKGKAATVIMFISTRCPVSNAYDDRMESLATRYAAKHIAFIGINANQTESVAEVAGHAKDHNFTFPVLKDSDDKVADLYDAHVTPETYVVNASGVIVYHGRIDNSMDPAAVESNDLANALDDVLAGKSVTKPETKAFGCSIKRAQG